MRKKKLITILFYLLPAISAVGQDMMASDFREIPNDLAARTQEKKDANGNACALVKVVLPLKDAIFEGWVVEQQYTPGEYWVYMPEGSTKLMVKHAEFPPMVYDFPDKLIGKTTYKLTLEIHEKQKHYAFFKVKSNVKKCWLYIAGEQYEVKKGKVEVKLPSGTYNYVIKDQDDRYQPVNGVIEITDKDVCKTLNCTMEYTEEYIAEKKEKKDKRKKIWNNLFNTVIMNSNSSSQPSNNTSNLLRSNSEASRSYTRSQTRTTNNPVQPQTTRANVTIPTRSNYNGYNNSSQYRSKVRGDNLRPNRTFGNSNSLESTNSRNSMNSDNQQRRYSPNSSSAQQNTSRSSQIMRSKSSSQLRYNNHQ